MRTRIITIITLLLSTPMIIAQKSMDEIDRESFAAKLSPIEVKGIQMTEAGNIPLVRDTPAKISLDGTWQLAEGGSEKERLHTIWTDQIPARVPGSIHTALVENEIIPDPYIGQNDSIAEKQSYKTWWMKREFELDSPSSHCILSFGGIANKCTIWLNGKLLGTHEGMFGGPDFSIGKYLKNKNTLIVKLEAIPQMFLGNWPPNANESWKYTVVFNCVYGWHYAQIPSLGIWRSVQLKEQAAVEIESPFIATRSLDGQMRLTLDLHKESSPLKGVLYAEVSPKNFKGVKQYYHFDINSQKKQETLSLDLQIKDPHLWWPNDRGEQALYDLNLFFIPQKGKTAHAKTSFGIRTIEMRPLIDGAKEDPRAPNGLPPQQVPGLPVSRARPPSPGGRGTKTGHPERTDSPEIIVVSGSGWGSAAAPIQSSSAVSIRSSKNSRRGKVRFFIFLSPFGAGVRRRPLRLSTRMCAGAAGYLYYRDIGLTARKKCGIMKISSFFRAGLRAVRAPAILVSLYRKSPALSPSFSPFGGDKFRFCTVFSKKGGEKGRESVSSSKGDSSWSMQDSGSLCLCFLFCCSRSAAAPAPS